MRIYLGLFTLLLSSLLANAQTDQSSQRTFPRLAIKLVVQNGRDDGINDVAKGYLLEELSSINDVDVVQDNEVLCIHCMILPTKNALGIQTGYVLSYAISSQLPNMASRKLVDSAVGLFGLSQENANKIKQGFKNDGMFAGQLVQTCSVANLKSAIADSIASINSSYFDKVRQITSNAY